MKNKSSTEESVGILCFANNEKPMSGIIKHRYSDFHVHEIEKNGNVVVLTSTTENPESPYPEGYEEWLASSDIFFTFKPESDEQVARIYYEQPSFPVLTKDDGTVEIEKNYKKKTRQTIIHFTLYKENLNQQEAIGKIAQKVGKQKKLFGYAGIKDKRGITTQICSLRDVYPHNLIQATSKIGDNIKISNVHYSMNPISIGDLSGNRFTIVLRNIKLDGFEGQIKDKNEYKRINEGIKNRIQALEESGFINYFGMQRFGTTSVPTYYIGMLILKRQWKKIIDVLLEPQENEIKRLHDAKVVFKETHDAEEALKLVPKSAQTEYSLFQAISRTTQDKKGNPIDPFSNPHELFMRIDRKQRMLYLHSYQSFLWNHLVSYRIRKYGTEVVVGDYVLKSKNKNDVEKVTPENINRYTIFDVVIEMPSSNMENDQITSELIELMAQDNITLEMFQKLSSEYGASGVWRLIMTKVGKIEWELISHDDIDAPLIDSDLNKITKTTNRVNHVKYGKFTSLCLSFSLGSGQYATMLLRELLKRSTEWYTDSALSNKDQSETHWWSGVYNFMADMFQSIKNIF